MHHWVPSHVNLEGKDRADQPTNEATGLEVAEHTEATIGTFNHLIDRFVFKPLESIYTDHTSSNKDWYQTTIVVGHNFLNKRLDDIQLRRLRFWSYTLNVTSPSSLALCHHCQQAYNRVHYLLNRPPRPMYRRRHKGYLLLEDNKLQDHHLAALIIRNLIFRPDKVTPLLLKNPGL